MRGENRVSRQEPNGCGKIILLFCKILLLSIAICLIYAFVPASYYSPVVQRFLNDIRQFPHIFIPAEKELDLIAFVCGGGATDLYTIRPDGSHLRLIHDGFYKTHSQPKWSPDGNWIALGMKNEGYWTFSRHWSYESHTSEIYVIRFDGLLSRRLTYNRVDERYPRWSSDGRSIFFTYELGHRTSVRSHQISADGGEIKPINQDDQDSYRLSPQGHLHKIEQPRKPNKGHTIVHRNSSGGVTVFDTKSLLRRSSPIQSENDIEWSPNGKWIAIISASDKHSADGEWIRISDNESTRSSYHPHLYLKDTDTGRLERFVRDIYGYSVAWSPDSEWLAFASNGYDSQLFKIKRDGTALQQLTDMDCHITELSWSPK